MIRRVREFIRAHVERPALSLLLRPDPPVPPTIEVAEALLPAGRIGPRSICYCAGVGEDIALERYLAEALGARVWAFDPTPRAIDFMATASYDRSRIVFEPVGLWQTDTVLRFNAPANPAHVSHSVVEELGGEGHFDAPCVSLASAMAAHGHDRIDVLKMNIEGAEDVVLAAALGAGIRPAVIALTWEGPGAMKKAVAWTSRLRRHGYRLLGHLGWYFTYVADD